MVKKAVIIGVNKYKESPVIPELKGAEYDASELYEKLIDQESGGFEIADGHFLTGETATCDAIRRAMSDLLWKTDGCDLSLFYFSGHGFHDEYGNGYIAPWDMCRDAPLVRGIRLQELTELLLAAKRKETVLLILDCCYSGIATEGKGGLPAGKDTPHFVEWVSPLGNETKGEGKIVLASAGKDEKSHELHGCVHTLGPQGQAPHSHGAFTFHLLEALDGKAATAPNDAITLSGLRQYIESQMGTDCEHKPTFFGAGMRQENMITIARASQWRKISESLRKAKQFLELDEPDGVFAAAQALGEVIQTYTTLDAAIELKSAIDGKLCCYRDPANFWLLGKRFKLGLDFRELFKDLGNLAGQLSVDTIISQNSEMQGLLATLCGVSSKHPASDESYATEESFVYQLKAYSSAWHQKASVARPKTQAQAKPS